MLAAKKYGVVADLYLNGHADNVPFGCLLPVFFTSGRLVKSAFPLYKTSRSDTINQATKWPLNLSGVLITPGYWS